MSRLRFLASRYGGGLYTASRRLTQPCAGWSARWSTGIRTPARHHDPKRCETENLISPVGKTGVSRTSRRNQRRFIFFAVFRDSASDCTTVTLVIEKAVRFSYNGFDNLVDRFHCLLLRRMARSLREISAPTSSFRRKSGRFRSTLFCTKRPRCTLSLNNCCCRPPCR